MEPIPVTPDSRVTLDQLYEAWEPCRSCELGTYREDACGSFVFGEGSPGSIMFIGEGPGRVEDEKGRPFIGESGAVLRAVISDVFGKDFPYYLTNTVCCRSCGPSFDTEGNQQFNRGKPVIKDIEPPPVCIATCRPRLVQEIYIVDPVLIVTLGRSSSEALLGHSVTITAVTGKLHQCQIPGAMHLPSLTPKGKWGRCVGKKEERRFVWPTKQNMVTYDVMPLLHPAFVLRNDKDNRIGAPKQVFADGMIRIREIYSRYVQEVYPT